MPVISLLLVASSAVIMQSNVAVVSAAAAATTTGGFGPLPAGLPIESRCQDMTISTHIVFVGQYVAGHANGGICGVTGKDNSWSWAVNPGPGVKGCEHDATYCEFKATASTDQQLVSLCINGANVQGAWTSCDYYGVVGDNMGIIDGHVLDRDGSPVAGVAVTAGGSPAAGTTSDSDGFYAMQVKKGAYKVSASDGVAGHDYQPAVAATTVSAGATSHVDFTLDNGIKLKMEFKKTTVVANGYEVIEGTITTRKFNKPDPNVMVQLDVKPTESGLKSATTGARASICSGGSRQWPTNSLNDPDGYAVNETTDGTGTYDFTITVGTTPGVWSIDAWAFNSNGTLSKDFLEASVTKDLTFTSNGSFKLRDFVNELNVAAQSTSFSTLLSGAAGSANSMWTLLSQTTKSKANGVDFGGLAYSLVNAKDGQSLLIFPEKSPPVINKAGEIVVGRASSGDLVYDPAEWTGAGLPGNFANAASLTSMVSGGHLPELPTLAQFDAGKSVTGWKTVKGDEITLFSGNFEFDGWGYPSTTSGACY